MIDDVNFRVAECFVESEFMRSVNWQCVLTLENDAIMSSLPKSSLAQEKDRLAALLSATATLVSFFIISACNCSTDEYVRVCCTKY